MFKSIITAAVIATATFTTSVSAASMSVEDCVRIGTAIELMADARDRGLTASQGYELMASENIPDEIAIQMLEIVFLEGRNIDGETLKGAFIGVCVGETT